MSDIIHDIHCNGCEEALVFECDVCRRMIGQCFGRSDDKPHTCDDCYQLYEVTMKPEPQDLSRLCSLQYVHGGEHSDVPQSHLETFERLKAVGFVELDTDEPDPTFRGINRPNYSVSITPKGCAVAEAMVSRAMEMI